MPRALSYPRLYLSNWHQLYIRHIFKQRLFPARTISLSLSLSSPGSPNIPCIVWGSDTRSFIYDTFGSFKKSVELVVPDEMVDEAAEIVVESTREGSKERERVERGLGVDVVELVRRPIGEEERMMKGWGLIGGVPELEKLEDGGRTWPVKEAAYLARKITSPPNERDLSHIPNILIHPASSLNFPIHDTSKTLSLPSRPLHSKYFSQSQLSLALDSSWDQILFPTLSTFINTITNIIFMYERHQISALESVGLRGMLWSILEKQVFDNGREGAFGERTGSGLRKYREVMEEIEPENRAYIEKLCLDLPFSSCEGDMEGRRRLRRFKGRGGDGDSDVVSQA